MDKVEDQQKAILAAAYEDEVEMTVLDSFPCT